MFDIKGDKISLKVDELAIPPFKDYYNNSTDKETALKEIEYVVWLYKWNTPYEAYPESERAARVAKDLFGTEEYKVSEELNNLAERFKEFQETSGTRLLHASQTAAEGLISALNDYSKGIMDIDTAIKITRILKDVGNIVKSLDIAMKQARAEQLETGRVKGGGVIGLYEMVK